MTNKTLLSIAISSVLLLGANAATFAAKDNPNNEQGSTNGQPFKTLTTHLELLESNFDAAISDLQSQIDALNNSQDAQDELIATLFTAIDTLGVRIDVLDGKIDDNQTLLESRVEALEAQDIFLQQLINILTGDLSDLEIRVAQNEGDIAAIIKSDIVTQQLITAIKTNITNLEILVDNNAGDITTLNTNIDELNIELLALQTTLATKQDRIKGICAADSSIREIKADGSVVCEADDVGAGVGNLDTFRTSQKERIPGVSGVFTGQLTKSSTCPTGSNVTGGGYKITAGSLGDPRFVFVSSSKPISSGWQVSVINDNIYIPKSSTNIAGVIINTPESGRVDLEVYATCGTIKE